jgi:hypothetical protein
MCGLSWGRYHKDGITASIGGFAIPVGIDNKSFMKAIKNRSKPPYNSHNEFLHFTISYPFNAFVIPIICATVKEGK